MILARCLAAFAVAKPGMLELIMIADHPEPARFIGLGPLSPLALGALWDQRHSVTDRQIAAGARVWDALRAADPTGLADIARDGMPDLPFMAHALRRHCQEFPWTQDGLGLTERLALTILSEQTRTMGLIFHDLVSGREPLPWLGDIMLGFILKSMKRLDRPVFTVDRNQENDPWPKQRLTITDTGLAVLAGRIDFLSLNPPVRYLGGVRIAPDPPVWRWDDQAGGFTRYPG